MASILCVDDEPAVGVLVESALLRLGHDATLATSVAEAMEVAGRRPLDLILCDYSMPEASGIDLIRQVEQAGLGIPVIIMTGYASVEHAVHSMQAGAADYLTKPIRLEALRIAVDQTLEVGRLKRENQALRRELAGARGGRAGIVGESAALRRALDLLAAVAPTRATVLLEGESGTGKELFARALHEQSPRHDGPFVTVNCAALPEGLVESVLFGHEKGAFTGATGRSVGAFERADKGTLLLDEISEMRLDLQAKLLRAVQEQEFERVGGGQPIRVDVRLVATTNRDLKAEVAAGKFRQDLYYRLNVVAIATPPLRERREDVPLLAQHFVAKAAASLDTPVPTLSPEALAILQRHPWPGNVREFANAIERAVILARGGVITPEVLPPDVVEQAGGTAGGPPADAALPTLSLDELEKLAIARALEATGGNRTRAAKILGISERTLRNKLNTPAALPPDADRTA